MTWYNGFLILGGAVLLAAIGLFRPASKNGAIAGLLVMLPGIIGLFVAISNTP